MDYKIEKGIPLPPARHKYPFSEMEVGDSFQFEEGQHRRISTSANHYASRCDDKSKRFSIKGNRVWRIK